MVTEMSIVALVESCIIVMQLTAHFVSSEEVIYVSRVHGNDNSKCGTQLTPCRSISYGIHHASDGSYIYLDGADTSKDPYTCQPFDSRFTGINLTKSISFVSIGSRAYISCLHGNQWLLDGTGYKDGLRVGFSGLALKNASLSFIDAQVTVNDCWFQDSYKVAMNFTVFGLNHFDLTLNNVIFQQNSVCLYIVSYTQKHLFIHLTNSSFIGNGKRDSTVSSLPTVLSLDSKRVNTEIDIQIRNCSFKNNIYNNEMIVVQNKKGTTNVSLEEFKFHNNRAVAGSCCTISLQSARVTMNMSFGVVYNTLGTLLSVFGQSSEVNIADMEFNEFYSSGKKGGAIDIKGTFSGFLSIKNSLFHNGRNHWYGGAVSINATKLKVKIQNSTFKNISSLTNYSCGGAVYVESNDHSKSPSRTKDFVVELKIANSSFSDNTADSGGAVCVFAENLLANIAWSVFERNNATVVGPAVRLNTDDSAAIQLEDLYFIENTVRYTGIFYVGALGLQNSSFNFVANNVWFIRNKLPVPTYPRTKGILLLVNERRTSVITMKYMHFIQNSGATRSTALYLRFFYMIHTLPSITLDHCTFRNNAVDFGALAVLGNGTLSCKNSIFDSNGKISCLGTTFYAQMRINSKVIITNATFTNNLCGAVKVYLSENVHFKIKDSTFVRNRCINCSGAAIRINSTKDDKNVNQSCKNSGKFRNNTVVIENVWFRENIAASGGAIDLADGKLEIVNCTFVDNFAHRLGGQAFIADSAETRIVNSVFKQTVSKILVEHKTEYVTFLFLVITGADRLLLQNTKIDSNITAESTLILVRNSKPVQIDNSSILTCSVGHAIEKLLYNYQDRNDEKATTMDISCKKCDHDLYSLQRGRTKGEHKDGSFKCIPCPRGADCTNSVRSKSNFWGYQDSINPPTLAFTLCPFGYCKSPQRNSSKYNECQGKRTGIMCGKCSNGYTEALWSTQCTKIKDCNDHWFWIAFLALVYLLAILLVFKPPIITYSLQQVLWFRRFSRGAKSPQGHVIPLVSSEENATEEKNPRSQQLKHEKRQFSCFLEIIFYFYQIARLLLSSYSLIEFFEANFLPPLLGFFNFEPNTNKEGFLCPFPGLTPKTKLVFKLAPVFGTMIAIFTIYLFHLLVCQLRKTRRSSISPYLQASIKTVFLGYVTMATVSFKLIRCVPVAGKNRWFYNGNVTCYQWWQYASFVFNSVFVIPLIFVLAWASLKLQHNTLTVTQFLLAMVFPLPLLIYWLFRFVCSSSGVDIYESPNLNAIKEMLLATYKQPGNETKYGALYWQSVLIARRFVLVFIFCTVTDPFVRLFCMTLACVFVLYYHVKVKPFRNGLANNLESLSLLFLIILGFINLSKSVFLGNEENIKGTLITVFNVFKWIEIVILGLFPALLLLLVCLAVISLLLRALFICLGFFCKVIIQALITGKNTFMKNYTINETYKFSTSMKANEKTPILFCTETHFCPKQ